MSFSIQIFDYLCLQYLTFRSRVHLQAGFPPIASFAFDYIGHKINLKGRYEGADLAIALGFLRSSGFVDGLAIDVGANIGNHSLFFADYFKRVISLEPNPRVFELLRFNAKLKNNIQPMNIAASDTSGEMSLQFDPLNWGGGKLTATNVSDGDLDTVCGLSGNLRGWQLVLYQ